MEQTSAIRLEPWQHQICTRLERLLRQTGQRLLIHAPPQFGKSILVSQRFPAYALQRDPLTRIRLACYNVTHAERFSSINLQLCQEASLLSQRASVQEWSTTARAAQRDAQPSFVPLGLGTGFTGLGADILILDDPYKNRDEARSEVMNAKLRGWWTDVVLPRLNPASNVVVMFHRWWDGDFAGYLIQQGGWDCMRFPAIADGGADDPTGRSPGALLSPRYSLAYLEQIRREQGASFDALYQGTPLPATGGMFPEGRVTIVAALPVGCRMVRWWDKAATAGAGDYTAGVLVAVAPDQRIYIADVVRGQWDGATRDQIIRQTALLDRQQYGYVLTYGPQDPGQAGKVDAAAFVQLLSGLPVATQIESGSKEVRAAPLSSQWQAGNVHLLDGHWNADYLAELTRFPFGTIDDQVDASSGAYGVLAVGRPRTSHAAPSTYSYYGG